MRIFVRPAKKRLDRRLLCALFWLLTVLLFSFVQVSAQASLLDQRTVERGRKYESHFVEAAQEYGVDARLLWVIAYLESRFRSNVVSHKNARGLMQFMPATAQRFGVRDPHEPASAIAGAARYIRFLLQRFGGRLDLTLAAYNAGEAAVDAYQTGRAVQVGSRLINPSGIKTDGVPPYRETRQYVREGVRLFQQLLMTRDVMKAQKPHTSATGNQPTITSPSLPRITRKSIFYRAMTITEGLSNQPSAEMLRVTIPSRSILFQSR